MCSAQHVPPPPRHPLGAVSECNDSFPRKGSEAKEGPLSRRSIPDWPVAAEVSAVVTVFNIHGKETSEMRLNERHFSLLSFRSHAGQ